MTIDIVLRNGQVVLPHGRFSGDIAIDDGNIFAIGDSSAFPQADRVIDVSGKFVIPGLVDPHMHMGIHRTYTEDCKTEPICAAVGGVTTFIRYFRSNRPYEEVFWEDLKECETHTPIDFGFHLYVMTWDHMKSIPKYESQFGVTSFKFYMAFDDSEARRLGITGGGDAMLYAGFREIGRLNSRGSRGVACIHAENSQIIEFLTQEAKAQNKNGLKAWDDARPAVAEAESIQRASILAKETGCPLYVAHLSSKLGLETVRAARNGQELYVETCPHYLTFSNDDNIGNLGKKNPPLRGNDSKNALWDAIEMGQIDTVGSDHSGGIQRSQKNELGDIWSARPGFGGVSMILPILLDLGVNKRKIPVERVVELTSYNPARIFGLLPRKGAILPGAAADLVVVDLKKEKTVQAESLYSGSDFSIYEGMRLTGWPIYTIAHGEIVCEDGTYIKPATGGKYIGKAAGFGGSDGNEDGKPSLSS